MYLTFEDLGIPDLIVQGMSKEGMLHESPTSCWPLHQCGPIACCLPRIYKRRAIAANLKTVISSNRKDEVMVLDSTHYP